MREGREWGDSGREREMVREGREGDGEVRERVGI